MFGKTIQRTPCKKHLVRRLRNILSPGVHCETFDALARRLLWDCLEQRGDTELSICRSWLIVWYCSDILHYSLQATLLCMRASTHPCMSPFIDPDSSARSYIYIYIYIYTYIYITYIHTMQPMSATKGCHCFHDLAYNVQPFQPLRAIALDLNFVGLNNFARVVLLLHV